MMKLKSLPRSPIKYSTLLFDFGAGLFGPILLWILCVFIFPCIMPGVPKGIYDVIMQRLGDHFVGKPFKIYLTAMLVAILLTPIIVGRIKNRKVLWPMLITITSWFWYGLYEQFVIGNGDIRIDLLVTYPFLLTITFVSLVWSAIYLARRGGSRRVSP